MPPIISRIAAHFVVATIRFTPCLPRPHHPTALPPLLDQPVQYHLHLWIGFPLPPFNEPSMALVALVLPLHVSTPCLSDGTTLILPPQVLTMTTSMTPMRGVTSTGSKIFRRCLNATPGVMLRLLVLFSFSLVFLWFLPASSLVGCSILTSRAFFHSNSFLRLRS